MTNKEKTEAFTAILNGTLKKGRRLSSEARLIVLFMLHRKGVATARQDIRAALQPARWSDTDRALAELVGARVLDAKGTDTFVGADSFHLGFWSMLPDLFREDDPKPHRVEVKRTMTVGLTPEQDLRRRRTGQVPDAEPPRADSPFIT